MLAGLGHLVDSVVVIDANPAQPFLRVERIPDGTTTLMWHDHGGGRLVVAGPNMRAKNRIVPREPSVSFHLRAGAASALFTQPIDALADQYVRLDRLWGDAALALTEELARLPLAAVQQRLARVIHDRACQRAESSTARLSRAAIRVLRAVPSTSIAELAAELGVSARHLRRAFTATVGIGPKDFARVARLQRALAAGRDASWSMLARDAGYYDQAHMISEFRALLGATPEAHRRGALAPPAASSRADHSLHSAV